MRHKKHTDSVRNKLQETKLEMEQVKLAKLRGVHSSDGSHVETFLHYEDLPPMPPEDRERLAVRHKHMMRKLYEYEKAKMEIEVHDVNPNTHSQITGEPYDYSELKPNMAHMIAPINRLLPSRCALARETSIRGLAAAVLRRKAIAEQSLRGHY